MKLKPGLVVVCDDGEALLFEEASRIGRSDQRSLEWRQFTIHLISPFAMRFSSMMTWQR